ncbi:MSMEG_6728 family protein [Streptomyces sp. NPDC086010]|uniref:MSMEG_6728 family protein n=1 Tax=Streptomyces sp. NPDC086010 TaxID=3365745 RepID=UPI0037D05937
MQTFLPFPDFTESAAALDPRRLGKQRVEALQVLRGLIVPGYGWRRHPAVRMWAGYEEALVRYGLDICEAWTRDGRADTCAATLVHDFTAWKPDATMRTQAALGADGDLPGWLGNPEFHRSHRSALLRRDPDYYRTRFPDVADDVTDGVPYVWPRSDRDPEAGPGLP